MKLQIFDSMHSPGMIEKNKLAKFLHKHLDKYRDSLESIIKALDYALQETSIDGGFILKGYENNELIGIVVVNRTGMEGYIPENVLVYIAVHQDHRGKGYGRKLMDKAIELAHGSMKLHVEPDNPARFLYEKCGFENKYLEYRLNQ